LSQSTKCDEVLHDDSKAVKVVVEELGIGYEIQKYSNGSNPITPNAR